MTTQKLRFGKHRDKTYDEVAKTHPQYLKWIINTFAHFDPRVESAKEALSHDLISAPPALDIPNIVPEHFGNGKEMMDFQKTGLAFVEGTGGNAMISDQPGLGKTCQSLAYLALHPDMRPAVVVCPASLKLNWEREADMWLETGETIEVINGGKSYPLTGDIGIIILNYDVLKKWLPELKAIKPQVLIYDESHNCFMYDTLITTDHGMLPIGDIVENKIPIKALCYDLKTRQIKWRNITHYFKNPKPLSTIKITHEYGRIICTSNHRIWTDHGYVPAEDIQSGASLRVLRGNVPNPEQREERRSMLFLQLRGKETLQRPRRTGPHEQSIKQTDGTEALRVVRETLRDPFGGEDIREQEVLQRQLCGIVEDDSTMTTGAIAESYQVSSRGEARDEITRNVRTDEEKQPDVQSRDSEKGIRYLTCNGAQTNPKRWERQTPASSSSNVIGRVGRGLVSRTYHTIGKRGFSDRISIALQDRHSKPNIYDSDRSRRHITSQSQRTGSEKGYEIICSRVDSVEVLESPSIGRDGQCITTGESVYNIEVEQHHNYFADGVLVANCKNKAAARSKAAAQLAKSVPHKILLTGTPVMNRPSELWHQLCILDPETYNKSRFFQWHRRYCDAKQLHFGQKTVWDFSGASNLGELAESLKGIMIRRTKAEVLPALPAKRRQTLLVSIDNRREYNHAEKDFLSWIKEQKGHAAAERASNVEQLSMVEALRQIAIQGKMKQAIEWICDFLETGEKLVVFATHRATINTLMQEFSKVAVRLDGGMCAEEKQLSIDRFQGDDEIRLFVGNVKAAGQGIPLFSASNVIFLELDWTPTMHEQCEDRLHRIGQKKAVNCYYLFASDTIDEKIMDMLEAKGGITSAAIGDNCDIAFKIFNTGDEQT